MLGFPKYDLGDVVEFDLNDKTYTGIVAIIDKYGTFRDNTDVSYDILCKDENVLYKHIREDWITQKVGTSPKSDIWK